MLVSILHKLVEAFGYDVVDMYLAGDHGFEVLEPASKTRQRQQGQLAVLLTRNESINHILEFIVCVCQTALDRDFLQQEREERYMHLCKSARQGRVFAL